MICVKLWKVKQCDVSASNDTIIWEASRMWKTKSSRWYVISTFYTFLNDVKSRLLLCGKWIQWGCCKFSRWPTSGEQKMHTEFCMENLFQRKDRKASMYTRNRDSKTWIDVAQCCVQMRYFVFARISTLRIPKHATGQNSKRLYPPAFLITYSSNRHPTFPQICLSST